jgi:glycosyltransferase involved in cell wall biosynthesis
LAYNAFDAADLPELDLRTQTRADYGARDGDTVLVMAGFGFPWHGVDRAIRAMELLDDSHHLWLVGASSEADRMLVEENSTPKSRRRIRIFERMPPDELIQLFAGGDVGLGSLAFDRHSLTEAQPMKVALYLALGLPVIINYNDVRLVGDYPFVGRMTSREPAALVEALDQLKPITPALRAQTAQYAAHHLSWMEAARHTVELIDSIRR